MSDRQQQPIDLQTFAVLPEDGDNVAISAQELDPGTEVEFPDGAVRPVINRLLEGHRMVVEPIRTGRPLLSWGVPFATAVRDLQPGDVVATEQSLTLLRERGIDGLPDEPTAANVPLDPFELDEGALNVTAPEPLVDEPATFMGYQRPGGRVGTRNFVALIALTSRSSAFVTRLAKRFQTSAPPTDTFDGVVPVAHTEGGADRTPNNLELLMRTLGGMACHPNLGAVLVVSAADDVVSADQLQGYMAQHGLSIEVPHEFFVRSASFGDDLETAAGHVERWLDEVRSARRTECPAAELRIALQCGGSDAFSGITANPLLGSVAEQLARHGGSAVLAETDELIGAEPYVLKNVASPEVARQFLARIDRFKERAGWHGQTAEGNPSGGNVLRGLYNIVLKSIGAARKLDRPTRLAGVIDYGAPAADAGSGYLFMDSPGNDLESVAGQVASGCNLIFFTTGNGSITNFPFVPTLKVVTTSRRYDMLRNEMDIDAGRYLTGTSMADMTDETFDLMFAVASGQHTAGERAGHSQTSIWRDWKQTGPVVGVSISTDGRQSRSLADLPEEFRDAPTDGVPVPRGVSAEDAPAVDISLMSATGLQPSPDQIALLLPTSLCSGMVADKIATQAEEERWFGDSVSKVVTLPHTEGCGAGGVTAIEAYNRIMYGCLTHPGVRYALLLEHGCEKTHNDYFQKLITAEGGDPDRYGWASIQLDGGLSGVTDKIREWAAERAAGADAPHRGDGALGDLVVALDARRPDSAGPLPEATARAYAMLGSWIVGAGGTVIVPASGGLLASAAFRTAAFGSDAEVEPTLAHGQKAKRAGWHVMRTPTFDWLETVTALGASGAELVIVDVAGGTLSAGRLAPVLQVGDGPDCDLDISTADSPRTAAEQILRALADTVAGKPTKADAVGNVGFQITRGLLGASM